MIEYLMVYSLTGLPYCFQLKYLHIARYFFSRLVLVLVKMKKSKAQIEPNKGI